jgi:GMP synthase (glutamine-hydrolysing)
MPDIIVIEHSEMPAPDRAQQHLAARGFAVRTVKPFAGEAVPAIDERTAGVVIMGGPQMVTDIDGYPYLRDEMALADQAMDRGLPLLGICLGAQMIAHHLGATVSYHEDGCIAFGYYPIDPTVEGRAVFPGRGGEPVLHVPAGNAQGFDLPPGATLLARGEIFHNQAYRIGHSTYGFQFHPELTRPILDLWQEVLAGNYGKPGTQTREEQDAGFARYDAPLHVWFTGFLDDFFGTPER